MDRQITVNSPGAQRSVNGSSAVLDWPRLPAVVGHAKNRAPNRNQGDGGRSPHVTTDVDGVNLPHEGLRRNELLSPIACRDHEVGAVDSVAAAARAEPSLPSTSDADLSTSQPDHDGLALGR